MLHYDFSLTKSGPVGSEIGPDSLFFLTKIGKKGEQVHSWQGRSTFNFMQKGGIMPYETISYSRLSVH